MQLVHLIWYTSRPLAFGQGVTLWSFKKHHPKWKVWLWLIEDGLPPPGTSSYLDRLEVDRVEVVGKKSIHGSIGSVEVLSHLLRFALLYHFGGLYVDFDIVFYHPLPFATDRDVVFVDFNRDCPVFPVGMLYAPLPASPFWKEIDGAASSSSKMSGGTTFLSSYLGNQGLKGASLDQILDYLWSLFPPPFGRWTGLRLLDSRSYRPLPVQDAAALVRPSTPRPYRWLLSPLNPYRCFACQWFSPHPSIAKEVEGLKGSSILGRSFHPYMRFAATKRIKKDQTLSNKKDKPKVKQKKPPAQKANKKTPAQKANKKTPAQKAKSRKMKRLLALMAK
jgi:hypothetical protein